MKNSLPNEKIYTFKLSALPSNELLYFNSVFLNPEDFKKVQMETGSKDKVYFNIKNCIFSVKECKDVVKGYISLSKIFREMIQVPTTGDINISCKNLFKLVWGSTVKPNNYLANIKIEIYWVKKALRFGPKEIHTIDVKDLEEELKNKYFDTTINKNHCLPLEIGGTNMIMKVINIDLVKTGITEIDNMSLKTFGLYVKETAFEFSLAKDISDLKLKGINSTKGTTIFRDKFNFEDMGIGGLDQEFADIFRVAFASRRYPADYLAQFNIKHVKGMLFYGPPGTGKTLIARQLGKALHAKEPKKVSGPEIFDKYVGKSEENIRELFREAEEDYKKYGDDSELHIIIFDEIDAICRARGSINSGTGVHDSVVNQLLSKIDGVDSLNNILIIGMTNRKDMIDEAILRPGRLELHVEIGLPNKEGRRQILNIHTKVMKENGKLEDDIDFDFIAAETKNYTGAEIETLVKRAASYALTSGIDMKNPNAPLKFDQKISMKNFEDALQEVKPQFGTDVGSLDSKIQFGIHDYGENFSSMYKRLNSLVEQVKNSKNTNLLSVLLEGELGTGKTAIACDIAKKSEFPFVKIISPETLVGFTETGKVGEISKIFEDAYKSPLSLIILDNIERIIEFIKIGPRFSNLVLQSILVYIKKIPPKKNRKLLIIGTTSMSNILNELEVVSAFNVKLTIPTLNNAHEVMNILSKFNGDMGEKRKIADDLSYIPIKQLLLIIDMTLQKGNDALIYEHFCDAYKFFLNR